MSELIKHNCPVKGEMMIEKNKPCNWCNILDNKPILRLVKNNDIKSAVNDRHR